MAKVRAKKGGKRMSKVLARELATLERDRRRLEKEHMGKFVLIHGDEVVNTYDNFEAAATEGVRRFGRAPFLIRRIGKDVMELPPAVVYGLTNANPTS